MKLTTKEHERRLNKRPQYERRYTEAWKQDKVRFDRLMKKADVIGKLGRRG